jgi:hypothetical protein
MPSVGSESSGGLRHSGSRSAGRSAFYAGTAASVLSALALAACGLREEGSAAGPLNGPSQWIWGEREARTTRATVRHTLVGYAIHHLSSLLWATLHERMFAPGAAAASPARTGAEAMATAALAYVVDYHIAPRRFRPGFRKHLSPPAIFCTYAAFAAGLALERMLRHRLQRR